MMSKKKSKTIELSNVDRDACFMMVLKWKAALDVLHETFDQDDDIFLSEVESQLYQLLENVEQRIQNPFKVRKK